MPPPLFATSVPRSRGSSDTGPNLWLAPMRSSLSTLMTARRYSRPSKRSCSRPIAARWFSFRSERVFGYRAESLVGTNAFQFIHPDDRPAVQQAFETFLQSPYRSALVQFPI